MWRERLAALAGGVVIILTAAPAGASAAPGLAADETLTTAQGASPAVAFAPNGFAIAAWTETGNVGVALRPPGGPWSAPQEFTAGSNIEIPSVAVDSGGDAAVTWV